MEKVSFKDFQKLDIRVGTIISAEVPEWSHWVMKLTVDFASKAKSAKGRSSRRVRIEPKSREARSGGGDEIGKKTVFAGIMKFYKSKDLVGKQFVFVINLEPKKIGPEGDYSEAMVLAASVPAKSEKEEEEKPILLSVPAKVPNGTKVR